MQRSTARKNRAFIAALKVTDALLSAPRRWGYGQCSRHFAFKTKVQARYQAQQHRRGVEDGTYWCEKCYRGRPPSAFKCPSGEGHFHWGHGEAE